jgi:hypothetical protein
MAETTKRPTRAKRVRNRTRRPKEAVIGTNDVSTTAERRLYKSVQPYWPMITSLATAEAARLGQGQDWQGMNEYLDLAAICRTFWSGNNVQQRSGTRITQGQMQNAGMIGGETLQPKAMAAGAGAGSTGG